MEKDKKAGKREIARIPWYMSLTVVILNVLLLTGTFVMYSFYTDAYDDRLHEENIINISNLNNSASFNASALFDSWNIKLSDISRYARINKLDFDGTLDMINNYNSSAQMHFELIDGGYKGFLAEKDEDGSYIPLDYSSGSYGELHKIFDAAADKQNSGTAFAPEFTDGGRSASKYFAMYEYIPLGDEVCTLMLATESANVLKVINNINEYEGQSTVLIDEAGNYIVSSSDFKSSNFFQYLYIYNDLTLDSKNAIRNEMIENGKGVLCYKNADVKVEECVFCYERMENSSWFCVTSVPLSSFHKPTFNFNYIILGTLFIMTMFIIDLIYLQSINRRLRASMMREKEAAAAKGNFMSHMSHEIRTPLNAVIGYNTIARSEITGAVSEEERKQAMMKVMDCLSKSETASKHLLTIINDVLDMSAIESGRIQVAHEKFDFKGLITSLTTIFYSQARSKGVEFEVIFDNLMEEWFIGDQMRINQILTNLLSNAIKFTSGGGTVMLKINQSVSDTNAAHIHFEVSDSGIGMTHEYLCHIWTPFEQADSSISRRFGGTGLGLAITKNLVDLMGGTIDVRSTPGVGTVFDVDLAFEHTEQPRCTETYDFSTVNALVVDDDISTCDYIRLLFTRCGASCTAVSSGTGALDAIEAAKKRNEHFTVCLVDWKMPHMDGIETIKRMNGILCGETPIIVLTAYDYTELADRAAEVGVNKFISKPLFQSSLFDLLVNISGKQTTRPMERSAKFDFTGSRVLLAEDNIMNMEIACRILNSVGLTVDGVWNGKEAVERFENTPKGTYSAILMDVHMPEMDGHEATRTIRASKHTEAKTIPIIAMTADAFAENVAEAYDAGMNDHISKPIDVEVLLHILKKYI